MSGSRALLVASGLLGSGCGAASTLDPAGPSAERIAGLTWLMTGLAAAIYLIVLVAVGLIAFRAVRGTNAGRGRISDNAIIVGGGILLPALILPIVWLATLRDMRALAEVPREAALIVEIEARQFAYEVRYPGHGIVVSDEVRIPVGRAVLVRVTSRDVIHSFWVPRLAGKIDMIPGRTNERWIEATRPGTYDVICAEFCGVWHANMRMVVIAESPEAFDRWIRENAR